MGLLDAVSTVLAEADAPLHAKELTRRILNRRLWHTKGKTPDATVAARLYTDIAKKGPASRFVQTSKATFALNPAVVDRTSGADGTDPGIRSEQSRPEKDVAITTPTAQAVAHGGTPTVAVKQRLSFTDAAEDVLRRYGGRKPMHYRDITARLLEEGLVKTRGKTPEATLYAQVIQENARAEKRGKPMRFVRHGRGLVGLTEWLQPGVHTEIAKHNAAAEGEMLEQLRALDPADFEQLVGELLRALGIAEAEVTAYHGDKGIDATGTYELAPGLTVSIAVQAKRQATNVGRPVVQNLSGSLKPHQQGLIIATAGFAKNARDEAARDDKPLVWLIDGPQLVKLLIANDLGARRIAVELVEPTGFELASDAGSPEE